MAFVTFVVPTLGRDTLTRALLSLAGQSDPDWCAVVIGDGHHPDWRDDGEQLYEDLPPRQVHMVRGLARGSAGLTRQDGVEIALQLHPEAEWIAFLDDDDWLGPDYVRNLRSVATAEPGSRADVIVFRMRHPVLGVLPRFEDPTIRHGNVGISYAVRPSCFLHASFKQEDLANEGPEGNEDIRFLLDLMDEGERVYVAPYAGYNVGNTRTVRS